MKKIILLTMILIMLLLNIMSNPKRNVKKKVTERIIYIEKTIAHLRCRVSFRRI